MLCMVFEKKHPLHTDDQSKIRVSGCVLWLSATAALAQQNISSSAILLRSELAFACCTPLHLAFLDLCISFPQSHVSCKIILV